MTGIAEAKKQVKIGDYILTGKIGQGGIAEIFKARQESLARDVAIKILFSKLSDDPEILRRFERESVVIAKLSHPNIVHVIDKGRAGNRYYFVMEFVDGTSLREVIDSPRVGIVTKLEMLAQVCKALEYAHKNGVIHRDIKPANILIDRQGNPRVADFGIAQIVGTPDGEMTSSDVIMGTLSYMSPEQKVSSTNVDQTTDIYAMGVIIYEILCEKKPLGRFKMPSELNSKIDDRYDDIVRKCLAQDPKDRYQSAVDLKNALLNSIGGRASDRQASDYAVGGVESFVGNCKYLDTIHESRFGSTVLVENEVSKKLYVIKRHNKGEAGRKEAKLLTSLKHKNINNILGSGGDKKQTVIIADYSPGGSLADRMLRKYNWHTAMDIMLQIASGMDFAHKNNIIHGNLRPSNVLFDANDVVKIVDFGLPVHYDAAGKKNWYSPPEHKQSKQGDIYAAGVIIHQLLTGRNPSYDSSGKLRLDDVAQSIPEDLQVVVEKLLAIRVAHRYPTFGEMILDWDDFEQREAEARRRKQMQPEQPMVVKTSPPIWWFLVGGASLLVIVLTIMFFAGVFK